MSLRSLDIEMGAVQMPRRSPGAPKKDYSVRIRAGLGRQQSDSRPPRSAFQPRLPVAWATSRVTGLRKSGDSYVNDAYARAAVRISLSVQSGVGSIQLIGE